MSRESEGEMKLEEAMDMADALVRAARVDPCDLEALDKYASTYWRVVDALRKGE